MILRNNVALRINYDYISDVFITEQERLDFMSSLLREFIHASESLRKAIRHEDLLLYRKTLHYVGSHLEMLGLSEFKHQLEELKAQLTDGDTSALKVSGCSMITENFAAIDQQIRHDWQLPRSER